MAGLCGVNGCDLVEFENQVIRPRRHPYTMADLGAIEFQAEGGKLIHRTDLSVMNRKKLQLKCSIFRPKFDSTIDTVVVYLHGNGGCRADALPLLPFLMPVSIALFCFDFAGCGMSEGDFITLGHNERDDVESVVSHIQSAFPSYKNIVLWGKSMGAATAIMYASKVSASGSNKITCVVADSPYSSLTDVAKDIASKKSSLIPGFVVEQGVDYIRERISRRTGCDLGELNPKEAVKHIKFPILIAVTHNDELTLPAHIEDIFSNVQRNNYRNQLVKFDGDHFSPRTPEFFVPAVNFIRSIIPSKSPMSSPSLYQSTLSPEHMKLRYGTTPKDLFVPPTTPADTMKILEQSTFAGRERSKTDTLMHSVAEPSLASTVKRKTLDKEPIFESGSKANLYASQFSSNGSSLNKSIARAQTSTGLYFSVAKGTVTSPDSKATEANPQMKTPIARPKTITINLDNSVAQNPTPRQSTGLSNSLFQSSSKTPKAGKYRRNIFE